ncbi:MAG: DUF4422 domain-containing protein [Oscillospiraceae bacterium]|nr:DUF4422 domain-containing protein [Oscillospiraceae bacterium]
MDIRIIVATHKAYQFPPDAMYVPVHAGKALHPELDLGIPGDDTGENISHKNPNYCELTCLYWAWKQLQADYIGLAHYRRHFARSGLGNKWQRVLTREQLEALLEKAPVVLPKKRNYYIETNYQQYIHAHHEADLKETEKILRDFYPAYLPAYEKTMASTMGHRFNMFVMRQDLFRDYCGWLFDILFKLEDRLDISRYSAYDARVFGFVAERLLDVWLLTNHISYVEAAVCNMEKQHWGKKIFAFLKRKFIKKKV